MTGSSVAALLALALVAPAASWGRCSAGPVSSCSIVPCLPHHGPTQCVGNQCMCMEGYCEMGSALMRCRAQVGTCNILPCNWNHGGALAVECINGACLCHSGYHNDGSNKCESGWWPPSLLLSMNETQRLAAMPYNEPSKEDGLHKYLNTLADHMPLLLGAFFVSSLTWVAFLRVRRPAVLVGVTEESLYKPLSATDA